MRKTSSLVGSMIVACGFSFDRPPVSAAQAVEEESKTQMDQPRLIVRVDDIGFCHAANMALKRILDGGICTSVSVIVAAPWLDEAVEILRVHPEVSVGVHLTLNCEWREYRWGRSCLTATCLPLWTGTGSSSGPAPS